MSEAFEFLKEVRDMADESAEDSLGTDESAYEAYEKCAGWLQDRINQIEENDIDPNDLRVVREVETKPGYQVVIKTHEGDYVEVGPNPWIFTGEYDEYENEGDSQ